MKALVIAAAAAGILSAGFVTASEANSRHSAYASKTQQNGKFRRFSKREVNRLPIRVTRPPNAGHYTHKDFPLWAARAFQPTLDR